MCKVCQNTNKISVSEMVNEIMLLKGDVPRREYLKYKRFVENVYRELNLKILREARREFLTVDRKTNSIKLPGNLITFSSISIINDCNKLVPLSFNENIDYQDYVDIGGDKACKCKQCDCQNEDCGNMYKYEKITEVVSMKVPEGSFEDFTKTVVKRIEPNGDVVQEINEPTMIYNSEGIHESTELVKRIEHICHVDLKDCGCIDDTEANRNTLIECSCAISVSVECSGKYDYTTCKNPYTYNLNEEGTRMYFDTNFNYDKVLLRYYANEGASEIEIPIVAKDAVSRGAEFYSVLWDRKLPLGKINEFRAMYNEAKSDLSSQIHRMTTAEFTRTMLPPRTPPSY